MVFEFFGAKKKVVIGMAHIGALPGAPLYDADGGMPTLIEAVRARCTVGEVMAAMADVFGRYQGAARW